jgi:hypothetical protein
VNAIAVVLCIGSVVSRGVAGAFNAQRVLLIDRAAAETAADGSDTEASKRTISDALDSTGAFAVSFAVSQLFEAAVLVLEASAFLLFFPACIVMFWRVERRLETLIQEMKLRSDHGNAFLPFEFSPPAADGSHTQVELPIVEVRQFLQTIKSSAASQRVRFIACLTLVMLALCLLAIHAVFVIVVAVQATRNPTCSSECGQCQSIPYLMLQWYINTPELLPPLFSFCSTLPLVFALWLMTTPEDRALLLHPERFRTDAMELTLNSVESETQARLRTERIRMGINLK